jgi:ribosomal protein S18 acetylase RimI-like enzyme
MAAVSDSPPARIVDLRELRPGDLDALLLEESQTWYETLDWDFRASAALVRRFHDMQALNGTALLMNGYPVGYCYFVSEERKGLIGDLYVMKDFFTPENEAVLMESVVDRLIASSLVKRIESQLMMLRSGPSVRLPQRQYVRGYLRNFMEVDLAAAGTLPERKIPPSVLIDGWTERKQDDAAGLIVSAYQGHIDSQINDQYRSPAGARRFLLNIIQYPGCGSFFQPASFVALDASTGKLVGMLLSSLVHADIGHITQVCVSHATRGTGVGYELIRRSLEALAKHGCRKASLTVTAANTDAILVYEQMGFRQTRVFSAYVWEGF